jgi:triacylglycerol lipase
MKVMAGAIRRATRGLLAIQAVVVLLLYIAAIRYFDVRSPLYALAGGVACVVVVRMLIVANNFMLAIFYRNRTPSEHRLGLLALLRLFLREFAASMASSSWTMAFHGFDKRVIPGAVGLPVLLVHGYACNSGYWHAMSRALTRARITHYAIDLEPVFSDIDGFVPQLHEAVRRVCRETGAAQIILLAHSMGGLVVRAYLRDHGSQQVRRVITLGTPHQGTGLANFGFGRNSRQMRWTGNAITGQASQWLQHLEATEDAQRRKLYVSIFSHHDNIVSPQQSSRLPGAVNIEVTGIGHVALAFAPQVQDRVIEEIMRASAAPA